MTRRNLSDILRQEVKKETSETSAPEAQPANAADKATTTKNRKAIPSAEPSNESDAAQERLTAQMTELKAALAQGADHEKELQTQIKSLQAEVKRHQKEVATLEAQAAQDAKLKTELAEAKAVILQLSEANTQMSESLDALKAPKATPKAQPQAQSQRKTPLALRPLPSHSVQHSIAPSGSVSKPKSVDVGWMD
jgi:predicted RNase H-like nuclease (RuvC/YqgF family)